MRYFSGLIFLLLSFVIASTAEAQSINFEDGFEDGDLTGNPAWSGDEADFTVTDDDPNYLLQLDAAGSSPSYLSTSASSIEGYWQFYIEFRGFEPSGSNQAEIFLMSDISNLEGSVNGYAIQVGESGDDVFHLVRYDSGSEAAIVLSGTTVVQSGGGYTIRVDRDNNGNWQMQIAEGYGLTSATSQSATDNTHTSASYFGPKISFTSSRSDLFYLDFKIDLPPFTTTDAQLASATSVDMAFNRAPDQATIDASDFTIDNGVGSPSSISFPASDTVRLSYNESLSSNKYTVSTSGIRDQSGNSIQSTDQLFYVFDSYASGDVKINEFMADPPSGQAEYVEVINTSGKYLNLAQWEVGDDEGTEALGNDPIPLEPNGFRVVSADTTALFNTYGSQNYILLSALPSLNNSDDAVQLVTAGGSQADSLFYTSAWGGNDVALERRSLSAASIYSENWGNSPNSQGGTPGQANEVASDNTPPRLTNLTINSPQTLTLAYNERLDQPGSYNITSSSVSSVSQIASDTVELTLGSNLQDAQEYTLSTSNAEDIFGNTIAATDTSFTFYKPAPVDSGDVAINEFMSAPPSSGSEYIELYNHSDKSLDLKNWTLSDNRGTPDPITQSQVIVPPDSFIVITPNNIIENSYPDINMVVMGDFPSLNNGGDQIILRDGNGTLLDSLAYTSEWGDEEIAVERRTVEVSGAYQSNWGSAPNGFGTPGRQNEVTPDTESPELNSFSIRNSTKILLTFSEQLDRPSAENTTNYSMSDGPAIDDAIFASPDSVLLQLGSELQNATDYNLSVENVTDIFGNTVVSTDTTFTFYKISSVASGDVFINEFNFEPASGSTEYVEIYNPTSQSFDLQNWTLSDNRGNPSSITNSQYIMPPDSFVVIAPDNTLLSDYPDISLVAMNNFPALNNSGDVIALHDGSDTQLDSLQYTSTWGGNEVSLERRTTTTPAIYKENWGNAPSGNGSPGKMNQVEADQSPPYLTGFKIGNSQQLNLIFNERLDGSPLGSENLTISGGTSIESTSLLPPDTVAVTLSSELQNASTYAISAQNIQDIFGNQLASADTSFTFYEVSPVDSGDVFINEFSFDPPSGSTEYVEIYNATSESFNIAGWTLSDNRSNNSVITNSQYIVPPDSFVVIAPDNTLLSDHPDISLVTMSNFPALNGSGDDIKIRSASGALLDSLRYTSEWGGNDVALERRTVEVKGTFDENWGDAPNGFGTPGSINEIPSDDTPPFFEELYALDATTLQLVFSEKITASSATNAQNYKISPGKNIQLISARSDSVTLFLESELTSGDTYEVTATNISDIFGNTLSGATEEFEFLKIDAARSGDIVINEILYNPDSNGKADFVEIYNTTSKNFDLSNWAIGDASREATLPQNIQLQANSYLVLTGGDRFASSVSNGLDVDNFPSYNNNSGDDVYLKTNNGRIIDSLHYETTWGGSTAGSSLERKDPLAASNDASNWQTSSASSAGNQNISFKEDTSPPNVIFSKVLSNGQIEVRFDEFIQLTPDLTFFTGDTPLQIASFDSTQANVIFLTNGSSKSLKSIADGTTITVENLSDVKGNTTSSTEVSVAQPMQQSNLVINEIMFNPLDEEDDNRPDQSEYIELRNTQDYAVSLEGLYLHDAPDEDGDTRNLQPVITTAKWVPAQGKVLIHADDAASFEDSKTASFFDLGMPNMQSIMRVDHSSLSLAASGDAIYIADSTGATIDSVFYGKSWHNPNIIDTRGVALERVSPSGPSNDESNWGSSVNARGGTPNKENSIYQENAQQPQETGISFTPNPFSPDGDGHEDNLFINYKVDQQDYLIDVHIYDRYGRMVRELADGKQAGLQGQLIWNGRKDDGSQNRIGIYIVVFEAYDSASGNNKSFKKTVVLARKLN